MQRQRPTSVLVIAILQITFGSLSLIGSLCTMGLLAGNSFMFAAGTPEGRRNMQIAQEIDRGVEAKLPMAKTVKVGGMGLDVALAIMMLASGIGLLSMQVWARQLAIAYGLLSLGLKVYGMFFTIPIAQEVIADLLRHYAGNPQAEAYLKIMEWSYIGAVFAIPLLAIYPIIVLIVMFRPPVSAAFRGECAPEPQDFYDRPPSDPRW